MFFLVRGLDHALNMLRIAKDSLIFPNPNSSRRKDHDCLDIHHTRRHPRRSLTRQIRVIGS